MATLENYLVDLLETECPDITGKRRKRRRRRNKHVNPTSGRNLVKTAELPPKSPPRPSTPPPPPPPPPKCELREPRPKDPTSWVIMIRLKDEEYLHSFEEELPFVLPNAGIMKAGLKMHGLVALIYVYEEERATSLLELLKCYEPVFVGRTHPPFPRKRYINIHGLPEGITSDDVEEMLDCQFPGKHQAFELMFSHNSRRKPVKQITILTNDSDIFHQLLFCGGLRLYDDRITFKCSEHHGGPLDGVMKPKAKVMPLARRQCFRCLGYGHMAEDCKEEARCKRCGDSHDYRECKEKEPTSVCLNCGSEEHCSTSRSCPLRPGGGQKKAAPRRTPSPPRSPSPPRALSPLRTPSPVPTDEENRPCEGEGNPGEDQLRPPSPPEGAPTEGEGREEAADPIQSDAASYGGSSTLEIRENSSTMASCSLTTSSSSSTSALGCSAEEECVAAAAPAEGPGVSSTTADENKQNAEDDVKVKEEETAGTGKTTAEIPSDEADKNADAEDEDSEKVPEDKKDEENKTDGDHDDVHVFTGTDDADSKSTATAVASFFSDLFGAADCPSEPLTGKFVATLRSLQESVYEDIASRQPRRGPSSPRERKPAKKRRLEQFRTGESDSIPAPATGDKSSAAKEPSTGLPTWQERRVRLLENFLYIVNGLLDLEIE